VTGRAFDAVLCDIDGVLRHWPAPESIERDLGLPAGCLHDAAFDAARLDPALTGAADDGEWRATMTVYLADRCGSDEVARSAVDAWSALVPTVDAEVVALLRAVRAVIPVALVSNATTRLEEDLARLGLADVADTVVNSARVGVAKPDERIYRIAAERVGATVERCLFVDDREENVVAARRLGMAGCHFRTVDDLRAALAPLIGAQDAGLSSADSVVTPRST
jgi:putative hydrolase of the HAD superfamily